LIFYSYFDLFKEVNPELGRFDAQHFDKRWQDIAMMAKEVSSITPILLNGREVTSSVGEKNRKVRMLAVELDETLYLFLANPYYRLEQLSISLPKDYIAKEKIQGQIEGKVNGNKLIFKLPSLASGVFKLEKT